ncbi:Putrescine importer PuuP, partial [Pseudomonas aeruginosa]
MLAVFSQQVFPGSVFQDAESAANEVMLAAGDVGGGEEAGEELAAGSALASQASVSRILYS